MKRFCSGVRLDYLAELPDDRVVLALRRAVHIPKRMSRAGAARICRVAIQEHLAARREVWPPCDNAGPDGRCLGHERETISENPRKRT